MAPLALTGYRLKKVGTSSDSGSMFPRITMQFFF